MEKKDEKKVQRTECPVTFCMQTLGGKWKPIIIYLIRKSVNRFGMLERGIEGINKQTLTKQLREMESDGILDRKVYPEIPPRVEYSFTSYGESLFPIIDAMSEWGLEHMKS